MQEIVGLPEIARNHHPLRSRRANRLDPIREPGALTSRPLPDDKDRGYVRGICRRFAYVTAVESEGCTSTGNTGEPLALSHEDPQRWISPLDLGKCRTNPYAFRSMEPWILQFDTTDSPARSMCTVRRGLPFNRTLKAGETSGFESVRCCSLG